MSKKQGSKQQKSLSVSRAHFMPRKEKTWTIAYRPGTHSKRLSVPLGFAITQLLKAAKNSKEAKFILNKGKAKVDGIVRKSKNFPIGLFDILELSEKQYRVLIDTNGRLRLKEVSGKKFKLSRIMSKKAAKGGKIILSSNDGRSFTMDSTSLRPGDSVKTQLPENKIIQELKMEQGSTVMLISGKHVGRVAKIVEIIPGTMKKERLITLKAEGEEFQTSEENVFVIGKEKPEIELLNGE